MSKNKKIIISVISVFIALVIGFGCFFGIRAYLKYNAYEFVDNLPNGKGKKATVILLAGQSNASGCSRDDYLKQKVSTEKYAEYQNGYDNVYINYIAGTNISNGFVKCKTLQGELEGCFGPELGMAEKLNEQRPDELFFIIKCAWGATDLFNAWLSPSSDGKTGQLYEDFVKFVKNNLKYLEDKNYDIEIEGMCWMQGESDSFTTENATNYEVHLSNFIKDIRRKFSRYSAQDGIAFVDACIADNPVYWVFCDLVNQSKKAVADSSEMNVLIDTNAQGLTCAEEPQPTPDMAHYDSLSQIKLGHLFAEEVLNFM